MKPRPRRSLVPLALAMLWFAAACRKGTARHEWPAPGAAASARTDPAEPPSTPWSPDDPSPDVLPGSALGRGKLLVATRRMPGDFFARTVVLLLDYSPTTRRATRLALEKAGFNVILAETVEVGLAALQRGWPDAVLVNTDIPGMDGQAVCEIIHRENAHRMFPIFVVTPPEAETPKWADTIPNCILLAQPASPETIASSVAEMILAQADAAERLP